MADKDLVPAAGEPDEGSRLERTATSLVTRLVDAGIDGVGPLDPAAQSAQAALARAGSADAAVEQIVATHLKLAAAGGFVTGLGGFITLPVALPANVVGFYGIATRMVASIAHLRGYDLDRPEVRSAVLLTLVGADARSILAKSGVLTDGPDSRPGAAAAARPGADGAQQGHRVQPAQPAGQEGPVAARAGAAADRRGRRRRPGLLAAAQDRRRRAARVRAALTAGAGTAADRTAGTHGTSRTSSLVPIEEGQ